MTQTAITIPVTVDTDPVRPEPEHTFACCVACGGTLDSYHEQDTGLCLLCSPDEPLPILITKKGYRAAGRAAQ